MAAPDFYFAINATFRFLHDHYGKEQLVEYWRSLGREYYSARSEKWKTGGLDAVARDWETYFHEEPQADVHVHRREESVELDIRVCPAIKHLRDCGREIVPYFCEHCDHVCGAMAEASGMRFERTGGMGACQQRFVSLKVKGSLI